MEQGIIYVGVDVCAETQSRWRLPRCQEIGQLRVPALRHEPLHVVAPLTPARLARDGERTSDRISEPSRGMSYVAWTAGLECIDEGGKWPRIS